jgi:serine protease Do
MTLSVTVEEQPRDYGNTRVPVRRAPEAEADTVPLDKVGVEVADLTPETAESLGYPGGTKGVLIAKVDPDGLAAEAGLRRGMVVSKVDKKPVASAKALREALSSAALDKGVLLQVQTPQGGTNYVLLKAAAATR